MGRLLTGKRFVLAFIAICFVVIGVLPLFFTLCKSVYVDGCLSFINYEDLMKSGREWLLLKNSFSLAFLTTFFALIIGVPFGILFAKTNLPFRKQFTILFTIPLLIPPYITAISWFEAFGHKGLISKIVSPHMAEITSNLLFGLPGCTLVLFSTFLPIVILLTITYVKNIDAQLEEAGKLVFGWPGILKNITLPLIMPGILLALLLVFLLSLGELGVPLFLRYEVFSVETFTQFSAFYNFGAATAATVPLLLIALLALLIENFLLKGKNYQLYSAGDSKSLKIKLGKYKIFIFILVLVFCFIIVIFPLVVLVINSFSLEAYKEAIERAGDSLIRSMVYAIVGATFLTFFGFLFGYLIHNRVFKIWRAMDFLTIFLFTLSGTVIGIGLINFWNWPITNFIYATPVIIIFGYIAKYTALTSRITASALTQVPDSMEEAAQVDGAKWMRRMIFIIAPMAARGIIAGWLISYIFCMRDVGVTMLVYPPGHDTFPVRILTLMANGSNAMISALCVIMVVVTLLPLGIGWLLFKKTTAGNATQIY